MLEEVIMTIGAVLAVIAIVLGLLGIRISRVTYLPYIPSLVMFACGVAVLLLTTVVKKMEFMEVGLGGWGIACLFAAVIGFFVISVTHAFKVHKG
ncbi:hypothetical protein [Ornithinibacillus contaminans]|uniref:hypothetical protein n=1 Tax=Ornithinibacillus contaminans TaxID=694055 RepID=UPI00064D9890|nr:hypothetical protein [Ornithinibacillus contaminans]